MTARPPSPSTRLLCVSALGLALTGCVSGKQFPSLALRPAERADGSVTRPLPPQSAPGATPSDSSAQLAQLQETARAAHVRFAARRAGAERAAADAGPLGSESWAAASVALAGLEEACDQQSAAITAIDQLAVDRQVADAGAQGTEVTAILAARQAIAADAEADGAVVARLRQRLSK